MPRLSKIGAAALAAFGWTSGSLVSVSYLAVAGGGGGGGQGNASGAGGAGGFLTGTTALNPTLSYTVTVGGGGVGSTSSSVRGSNGSNSVFNSLTSIGGGGGGSQGTGVSTGADGGSGGGGTPNPATGGAGTSGQGNAGGAGLTDSTTYTAGGGGGGASAVGANAAFQVGGNGGAGSASSISGSSVTYAGGGGGGVNNSYTAGTGGAGGGGNGTNNPSTGGNGTTNLGGGGGGSGNGNGGSGGSGIVIISYVGAQQFGGGVVTTSGGSTIHTFQTSGTLSPLSSLTANFLVVAGGGGGGAYNGGGGGAGGLRSSVTNTGGGGSLESTLTIDTNSIYTVTVGAGGSGQITSTQSVAGSNSSFLSISSIGGGKGGGYTGSFYSASTGGSGGGAPYAAGGPGAAGTANQGFAGGNGDGSTNSGGGGGAGAVGGNATASVGGNGGVGVAVAISGTSTFYAGGGGGAGFPGGGGSAGSGGNGGGGNGGANSAGTSGTANTGGGGGGSQDANNPPNNPGGNGGSGVVIISYPGSTQQMAGGTVTVAGGNVIHTFTSSGFLTPIVLTTNSLRFRASATAYLNRTGSTATNAQKATYSFWFKRGTLTTGQWLFTGGASSAVSLIGFNGSSDAFSVLLTDTSGEGNITTALFRDPSAWYHFVIAIDTTQATTADRAKIYVNGVLQTVTLANGGIGINSNWGFNTANTLNIGRYIGASSYTDGYMTDINFIDGQALTPFSFGTTSDLGVWQPIRYGGSYGTNGFYLPFTNTTSTTTLGYDFSPNGNNWTTNNISLTAGSTYDSMTDVPTLTSATAANYCTLNAALQAGGYTLNDGNLNWARTGGTGGGSDRSQFGTIGVTSGKWYWEFTAGTVNANSIPGFGIAIGGLSTQSWLGGQTGSYFYESDGLKYLSGTSSSYGATFATGDIIGIAFDADAGTLTFYKNNVSQGQAASGLTSGPYFPAVTRTVGGGGSNGTEIANFGQQPFAYTPPSGFVRLNTFNLPTPTIGATASTTANKYMDVTTYTGNNTAGRVITMSNMTNVGFAWVKIRSGADDHRLANTVTGGNKHLKSNATDAESSGTNVIQAFSSNTFTVGSDNSVNVSGSTYVGWVWANDGTSGSTNTAGTITSTVSANTSAGFSVVTYTGNATNNATFGHSLGVAPNMVIIKNRAASTFWYVFHSSLAATYNLYLNDTSAEQADNVIRSTSSTTVTVSSSSSVNASGQSMVAYCFTQVAGYSAFGSYTGNGSADGPFVFTGFRPRFVMVKCSSSDQGGNAVWGMFDTSRNAYNVANNRLIASSSNSESTSPWLDINSNGFKIRETSTSINGSGATYIYMAFAESPFKYANAR